MAEKKTEDERAAEYLRGSYLEGIEFAVEYLEDVANAQHAAGLEENAGLILGIARSLDGIADRVRAAAATPVTVVIHGVPTRLRSALDLRLRKPGGGS
jgi:hypothetical protein